MEERPWYESEGVNEPVVVVGKKTRLEKALERAGAPPKGFPYLLTGLHNKPSDRIVKFLFKNGRGSHLKDHSCVVGKNGAQLTYGDEVLYLAYAVQIGGEVLRVACETLGVSEEEALLRHGSFRAYGLKEFGALAAIEQVLGINLERQYRVGDYYVDGYCKETNVAYEIDEYHYGSTSLKDSVKEVFIKDTLGCEVVRVIL